MRALRLTLFTKMLSIALGPFLLVSLTLQTVNYYLTQKNFSKVSQQFEGSLNQVSQHSIDELNSFSEQAARDLLQEILIAVGGSLQPGEAAKFLHLAQQQVELEQLDEFSFYGSSGQLELSSNENTNKQLITADILDEARTTKNLVIRGQEQDSKSLEFYKPLFIGPDMVRMQPDMKIGQLYGMLYVEMTKDRINSSISVQRKTIEEAIAQGTQMHKKVMAQNLWMSCLIVATSLLIISVLIVPMISKTIIKPLKNTIHSFQSLSGYLSKAASHFSSTSDGIAKGATEQAAGLTETTSSLEQITSMTRNNANSAKQADTLASEAKNNAEKGQLAIQKMNDAISKIKASSEDTAKINQVISDIAFQTNLLALNAAVEAARAGESGKGFAVVADEVRALALRSAEAAQNTTNLIEEAMKQTQYGVDITQDVSKVLEDIEGSVSKTASLINEISNACQEQAHGIEEISKGISQMDHITQSNADRAKESAGSSKELEHQAEELNHGVQDLVEMVERTRASKAVQDKMEQIEVS